MRSLQDFNYSNKRVLLRVDLNVPVSEGKILDDTRINKIIPTVKYLLKAGAKVIIASHFGRPKGIFEQKLSLKFLVDKLSEKLGIEVLFCPEAVGNVAIKMASELETSQVILLENLRFHSGEAKNDPEFAKQLASLADFYVNDAFSCSHRAHASITEIAKLLPSAAGLLLAQEVESLTMHIAKSERPMMAIIGGSKVSTKLDLLENLIHKVDYLVIGGAMANTFLKSQGYEIGTSFYEPDLMDTAKKILTQESNCKILLPKDMLVADKIAEDAIANLVTIDKIPKNKMILDFGSVSVLQVTDLLKICKTVILNGPIGVFEYAQFALGTIAIASAVAKLTQDGKLISVAGGGDIVAAISQAGLFDQFSYISTAGGAFLEWLEGKSLPGLVVLEGPLH